VARPWTLNVSSPCEAWWIIIGTRQYEGQFNSRHTLDIHVQEEEWHQGSESHEGSSQLDREDFWSTAVRVEQASVSALGRELKTGEVHSFWLCQRVDDRRACQGPPQSELEPSASESLD
jgi:hypothetical protein